MKNLGLLAAVLALCCALTVGSASQALAADCTTQGALALALADVLGTKTTSAQAAADALTVLGVRPTAGWNVETCLTEAVSLEVSTSFAALNRETGGFERAQGMINPGQDQGVKFVSPHTP
jgi:hypothetical protein